MRQKINLILGGLIAILSGCKTPQKAMQQQEIVALYGVPYATYHVSGKVIDEQGKPVSNLQVQIKGYDNMPINEPTQTNAKGEFRIVQSDFPVDTINVVVSDPTETYAADSTQYVVTLKKKKKYTGFYCGEYKTKTMFQVKKK